MIKLLEHYTTITEIISVLRSAAIYCIDNGIHLTKKEGDKFSWDKFTLMVRLVSELNSVVLQMTIDIFFDGERFGSIKLDFDQWDKVFTEFQINFENDGYVFNQKEYEFLDLNPIIENLA